MLTNIKVLLLPPRQFWRRWVSLELRYGTCEFCKIIITITPSHIEATNLLSQGHDDIAKVREGLVDCLGLGESHPLTSTILHSLTASQVNLAMDMVRMLNGTINYY